jgi:hypothetical protein
MARNYTNIIPECYVDTNLIQTLLRVEGVNHQSTCSQVAKEMMVKFSDNFAGKIKYGSGICLTRICCYRQSQLTIRDLEDSIDCGINPPDGSQSWIAPYAQEAFDKYIAPRKDLSTFIIEHSCLDIASNR